MRFGTYTKTGRSRDLIDNIEVNISKTWDCLGTRITMWVRDVSDRDNKRTILRLVLTEEEAKAVSEQLFDYAYKPNPYPEKQEWGVTHA